MEDSIKAFTQTLTSFCNHVQSSSDALKRSLDRLPVPLDSASSAFMESLNRRVSSSAADLRLLESMSLETVSFQELLGHCTQVYNKNQTQVAHLEHLLKERYGYIPKLEIDDTDEVAGGSTPTPSASASKLPGIKDRFDDLEEGPLSDELMSLQNLGLSDVCLASLASDANDDIDIDISLQESIDRIKGKQQEVSGPYQSAVKSSKIIEGEAEDDEKFVVNISKDDYESLPSYMKSLASWEELLTAVEKMNSWLSKKWEWNKNFFHQDELASLELGSKGRSYLLLLVRMKRVVVETGDGQISYRVL